MAAKNAKAPFFDDFPGLVVLALPAPRAKAPVTGDLSGEVGGTKQGMRKRAKLEARQVVSAVPAQKAKGAAAGFSGKEGGAEQCMRKRAKTKALQVILASPAQKAQRRPRSPKNTSPAARKIPAPARRFRGVYERQPGRWAADFRDSSTGVRQWLGTFDSELEAKAAYDAFERRIRGAKQRSSTTPSPASAAAPAETRSSACDTSPGKTGRGDEFLESFVANEEELAGGEDLVGLPDLGHLPLPVTLLDQFMCDRPLYGVGFPVPAF